MVMRMIILRNMKNVDAPLHRRRRKGNKIGMPGLTAWNNDFRLSGPSDLLRHISTEGMSEAYALAL